ncbi:MAG TPA: hypothetical protein VGM05_33610 [Planctomycetaceae bacterium]|jgi:hypothetical protein
MPDDNLSAALPSSHRAALLELGSKGSGGQFDPLVMSSLFTLGFVEVNSQNRRLVLTAEGRRIYQILLASQSD